MPLGDVDGPDLFGRVAVRLADQLSLSSRIALGQGLAVKLDVLAQRMPGRRRNPRHVLSLASIRSPGIEPAGEAGGRARPRIDSGDEREVRLAAPPTEVLPARAALDLEDAAALRAQDDPHPDRGPVSDDELSRFHVGRAGQALDQSESFTIGQGPIALPVAFGQPELVKQSVRLARVVFVMELSQLRNMERRPFLRHQRMWLADAAVHGIDDALAIDGHRQGDPEPLVG